MIENYFATTGTLKCHHNGYFGMFTPAVIMLFTFALCANAN